MKPPIPEMPTAILVLVHVPPTFRGISKNEVRRKLSHPANTEIMLDNIADAIVNYFNKPIDYKQVMTTLAANIPAESEN